jgi:hypothetical protein
MRVLLFAVWILYTVGYILGVTLYAVPAIRDYTSSPCFVNSCQSYASTCTLCYGKPIICRQAQCTKYEVVVYLNDNVDERYTFRVEGCSGHDTGSHTTCYYEKSRLAATISFDYKVSVGGICVIVIIGFFEVVLSIWLFFIAKSTSASDR